MLCPGCGKELKSCNYKGTHVDICLKCGGIWLDPQELGSYIRSLLEEGEIPFLETDFIFRKVKGPYTLPLFTRRCPRCFTLMKNFNYAYNSNIILEKCPHCQGIWVDKEKIIEIAKYNRGNPTLRGLGEALLEERKSREKIEELASWARSAPYFIIAPKIVLPLYDKNPVTIFPLVTLSLISLNTIIFLLQLFFVSNLSSFFKKFGLIPVKVIAGYWDFSLISSIFLHGGIFHLMGNMFILNIFGDNVEERLGHLGFLLFYLISGLIAGFTHVAFNSRSYIPCVGASGAISGVMGAYLILYPQVKISTFFIMRVIDIPAYLYLGMWISLQVLNALLYHSLGISQVAWFAHIGGFLGGGLIVYLLKKRGLLSTR